jgi:hypothetical protein
LLKSALPLSWQRYDFYEPGQARLAERFPLEGPSQPKKHGPQLP